MRVGAGRACLTAAVLFAPASVMHGQALPPAPIAVLQSGTLSFSAHATVGNFTGSTTTVAGAMTGALSDARGLREGHASASP